MRFVCINTGCKAPFCCWICCFIINWANICASSVVFRKFWIYIYISLSAIFRRVYCGNEFMPNKIFKKYFIWRIWTRSLASPKIKIIIHKWMWLIGSFYFQMCFLNPSNVDLHFNIFQYLFAGLMIRLKDAQKKRFRSLETGRFCIPSALHSLSQREYHF